MRLANSLRLTLGIAGLFAGGCMTKPLGTDASGAKPQDAHAGVPMAFSARVVGDKRPDFYSFKTMIESPQFKGKKGEDLALAFSKYFSSANDGACQFWSPDESEGRPQVRGKVADPLKLLNAYGYVAMYATPAACPNQPAEIRLHGETRSHTMDFALRPGETLIRSQRNEGRFPYPASWRSYTKAFHMDGKDAPRECDALLRFYGNGRWIYEPNLTAGYRDFAVGVRERHGIAQTEAGLAGAGQCVIPFVSPYPFVSVPDDSGDRIVRHDGSWITLRAAGDVKIEVSDPLGNWRAVPVAANGAEERIDLSPLLEARYYFNVRLTLGAHAWVSKFRFEGYLLTAPMTLPLLDEGVNVMTLNCRDKYGLATVPCEILPDFRTTAAVPLEQQAAVRHGAVRPGVDPWQVIAPKGNDPVQATFTFDAPAGEKFAWFYALASVAEGQTHAPEQPAKLEWSCDGGDFQSLPEAAIDSMPLQRDSRLDGEQILDRPGRTVSIRVTSDTPIRGMEFVGHLDMDAALSVRPEITHRWLEGGTERQFVAPPAADRYWFRCGPNPTGHVIEMNVPSLRTPHN